MLTSAPMRRSMSLALAAAIAAGWLTSVFHAQAPTLDLLLRNGRVVDGTGSPWFTADIGIRGDTIVRIAPALAEPATRVIDAGGQAIAPAFIDIHTHAPRAILDAPTAPNYARKGATAVMEGPAGSSPLPR